MDVYLIPVDRARYELYCELRDETVEEAADAPGWARRLARSFRVLLAAAERERRSGDGAPAGPGRPVPRGRLRRLRDRLLRWVAETIAEQRLLWHLRRQREATLLYPADLDEAQARGLLRAALERDAARHRFWLLVDGALFLFTVVLTPLPGPNLLAYYFAFRLVGHYLSRRGARHGLARVAWHAVASAPLADLRAALTMPPADRRTQVRAVAARLKLAHLPSFFDRTAVGAV